jgi:hypothetical protein
MKLEKFEKMKIKLEIFKLEKNFFALNKVLYYFSFLGNIFLIYFGYFFIKSTTDGIPDLFPYQHEFLTVFIALFLTGYELTKRFVIEQTSISALQAKQFNWKIFGAAIVAIALIVGSFYLSLNGAHRLIDTTEQVELVAEEKINTKIKELETKHRERVDAFNRDIEKYQERIDKVINTADGRTLYRSERETVRGWEEQINLLRTQIKEEDLSLEQKATKVETKTEDSTIDRKAKIKENDKAFVFMTFFLEFIVILGVSFNAYYLLGSYKETKELLETPKYKQLELNSKLLKLYYQNGKKQSGEQALSFSKLYNLVTAQKLQCKQMEIRAFLNTCLELGITKESTNRRKVFQIPYDEAKKLIVKDDLL